MSEIERDYELKIVTIAINSYLDKIVSITEQGLKLLEANCDSIVWQIATKIYSQSGHKVEFYMVRDIVTSRLKSMKNQLEVNRRISEQKTRQAAEEKARLEVNRRISEEKARQAAEEDRKAKEQLRLREQIAYVSKELGGDENKIKTFFKIQQIIAEQLSVEENKVNLDSHLSNNLGADEMDLFELLMALEEAFDIEIPDEVAANQLGFIYSSYSSVWSSWCGMGISSASRYSSSQCGGAKCIVKNFVDYIYTQVSASA